MEDQTSAPDAPQDRIDTLLASQAQIERGNIVAAEPVLGRMRAAIARIAEREFAGDHRKA
jgi:hypothetical protein